MGNIKMPSCITKAQGEQVEQSVVVVVVVSGNIDKEEQLFPILPPIIHESDSTGADGRGRLLCAPRPLAPAETETRVALFHRADLK